MEYVKWALKAVISAAIAFISALVAGLAAPGHQLTLYVWLTATLAALVALGAVFKVTNGPRPVVKPSPKPKPKPSPAR